MADRVCAVTGATGLLGRALCATLRDRGWTVRALVRDPRSFEPMDGIRAFRAELPDGLDPAAFEGVTAVVHCAYMSRHTTLAEARRVNEEGTAAVLHRTRSEGARFVFVSSTGAHPEARSYYARSKLAIEATLDLDRDLVIRPGLILGPGGLFQRIREALESFGVIPVFGGGRQTIQTVHVDDLCQAIAVALETDRTGRFVVAEVEAIELRALFRAIAARLGRRCTLVPLPAAPMVAALRLAEAVGLRLPLSSENVLGTLSLRTQPSADDLASLGVTLRGTLASLDDLLRADPEAAAPG